MQFIPFAFADGNFTKHGLKTVNDDIFCMILHTNYTEEALMCQAVLSHILKKDKISFRLCEKLKKITNDEGEECRYGYGIKQVLPDKMRCGDSRDSGCSLQNICRQRFRRMRSRFSEKAASDDRLHPMRRAVCCAGRRQGIL